MNADRKTAIVVGVLFIVATAFLFIGRAVYGPILGSPDYLELTYPHRTRVVIGILLEFMIVLAIPLIPVFFFPILKRANEALAVGYVVFRSLEAMVLISVAEINKLSLIGVSQDFLTSEGVDASVFQYTGSAIQAETVWGDASGLLYVPLFVVGALILYAVLFQSKPDSTVVIRMGSDRCRTHSHRCGAVTIHGLLSRARAIGHRADRRARDGHGIVVDLQGLISSRHSFSIYLVPHIHSGAS